MLAPLAALQLLLLVQADPGAQPGAAEGSPPAAETSPDAPNPPLPERRRPARPAQPPAAESPGRPEAPAPAAPTPAARAERARAEPARAEPAGGRQLSLLSGESLGGGSASLAWAGWSSLGIMYGQGVTADDDLAGVLDLDWADTELRLGVLYRRPLGQAGGFDYAARLGASWFKGLGSSWIHSGNHSDHGLELSPGLSLSTRSPSGIFSVLVDAPLTITMKYDAGLLFRPRLSVAYEAPVYTDLTVGARVGVGYRAGAGDAPLRAGRGELTFVLLAGYQLL